VIRLNYGVQRSERGGLAVQAISLLPALTGAWKEIGGGFQLSTSHAYRLNREALERSDLQQNSPLGRPARIVNMSQLGSALQSLQQPPVKALVVYNSNPAAVAPDQNAVLRGLRRDDLFTVVLEQTQTDTADSPISCCGQQLSRAHRSLFRVWALYMQLARPALPAPGEARSNVEVFAPWRCEWDLKNLLPRLGRRHDPDAARFGASVHQRYYARRAG